MNKIFTSMFTAFKKKIQEFMNPSQTKFGSGNL